MTQIIIESLSVTVRGVEPHTAEAAAALLGPALQQALAGRTTAASAETIHVPSLKVAQSAGAQEIASHLAAGITRALPQPADGGGRISASS